MRQMLILLLASFVSSCAGGSQMNTGPAVPDHFRASLPLLYLPSNGIAVADDPATTPMALTHGVYHHSVLKDGVSATGYTKHFYIRDYATHIVVAKISPVGVSAHNILSLARQQLQDDGMFIPLNEDDGSGHLSFRYQGVRNGKNVAGKITAILPRSDGESTIVLYMESPESASPQALTVFNRFLLQLGDR